MNTSYNKERVIEDGWKIVIINLIAGRFSCIPTERNPSTLQNTTQNMSRVKNATNNIELKTLPNNRIEVNNLPNCPSSSNLLTNSASFHANEHSKQRSEPDIFVISNPELDIIPSCSISGLEPFPSSHSSKLIIKDLEDMQFLAQGTESALENQKGPLLSKGFSSDSEGENTKRIPKSYRVEMGEKILSEMMNQFNDENAYIHYFKQLVAFEELVKNVDFNEDQKFKIEPFITFPTIKHSKRKSTAAPLHQKQCTDGKSTKENSNIKTIVLDPTLLNSEFSTEWLMRMQLRRAMLKNFPMFLANEKHYSNFVNSMIEFEEGLVKD